MNRIITWLIAAKLTLACDWAPPRHNDASREWCLYPPRIYCKGSKDCIDIDNHNCHIGADEVYHLIHFHSTGTIMSILYPDWTTSIQAAYHLPGWEPTTTELKIRWRLARSDDEKLTPSELLEPLPRKSANNEHIENGGFYFSCVEWSNPKFLRMKITDDVVIRLSSLPAGFAKLSDSFVTLKRLLATPLCVVAPNLDRLPLLCEYYNKVKQEHMLYGKAAAHLVLHAHEEPVDSSVFDPLLATLIAFVQIVMPRSTLSNASMLREDDKNLDGNQ
ncbi:unnamed protein product [Nippostrongylus brasiliensis]|uniref:Secreted protein n=1 Tax=Nippostrongylus brasiliensis TaxID=27835 RepID=A0A0N4YAY6_NIPBR|nr:hypothetical protein Q1695_005303 [Nippostrongylus brasiliensis]VDL77176.1 unnamed protein product [Nippostrongylus brasiliensis]